MTARFIGKSAGAVKAGLMPDIFAYSGTAGFRRPAAETAEAPSAEPESYAGSPRFLDDKKFLGKVSQCNSDIPVSPAGVKFHDTRPGRELSFKRAQETDAVTVEYSGKLKEAGFEMPSVAVKDTGSGDQPWRIVLFVETDDNGMARHVFVETGSGRKETDAVVCARAYEGKTKEKADRCFGRVTVRYSPKSGAK
jgi:hypothetical protein